MNVISFALLAILTHTTLLVAPGDDSVRPEWVELSKHSNLPLHCETIQSELWATRDEARSDAFNQAVARAQDFAADVAPRIKNTWQVPAWLVHDHLLREPIYVEEVDWTYGPMYRAHLLLELSPEKRGVLLANWHQFVVRRRMGQIGGGVGFLLVCLATMLAYLRLDDATRGYYSRWLFTGAAAVVASSAAALYTWIV